MKAKINITAKHKQTIGLVYVSADCICMGLVE